MRLTFGGSKLGTNPFRLFHTSIVPIKWHTNEGNRNVSPKNVPSLAAQVFLNFTNLNTYSDIVFYSDYLFDFNFFEKKALGFDTVF
jgi:hypothetical protein